MVGPVDQRHLDRRAPQAFAANRPPKPAPTITTRWVAPSATDNLPCRSEEHGNPPRIAQERRGDFIPLDDERVASPASMTSHGHSRRRLRRLRDQGDLAKVMTFRSLYRLEKRVLLICPVVGVAVDDWTARPLVQHAARDRGHGETIDDDGVRRSPRGSPTCRATSRTQPRTQRVAEGSRAPSRRCSTSRSRRSSSARDREVSQPRG